MDLKKFFAVMLICCLAICPAAFAAQVIQGVDSEGKTRDVSVDATGLLNIGRSPSSSTPISAVTLDNDPTSYTSAAIALNGAQRVGFYWTYDETEVGNSVSGALTLEVSPDNSHWFSANFYDVAGGATLQSSESLTGDGSYICWLDPKMPFGYVRVKITATNTDADDVVLTSVSAYFDR